MYHFLVLYAVVIILSYMAEKKPVYENLIYGVIVLVLSIFSGLRVGVGFDYNIYLDTYIYENSNHSLHFEGIWLWINKIFRYLGFQYHDWLFFISIITNALMYYGAKRNKINLFYFTLLYLSLNLGFISSLNLVRQNLAMAIIFASSYNIFDEKKLKFLLFTAIAGIFHYSAFLFLFIYPLTWIRINKYLLLAGISFSFLIGDLFFKDFIDLLWNIIPSKYSFYLEGTTFKTLAKTGIFRYFINALAIIMVIDRSIVNDKNAKLNVLLNSFVAMICFYNISYHFNNGIRFSYYLGIFTMILLPYLIENAKDYSRKGMYLLAIIGYLFFAISILLEPKGANIHYRTIYENIDITNPNL